MLIATGLVIGSLLACGVIVTNVIDLFKAAPQGKESLTKSERSALPLELSHSQLRELSDYGQLREPPHQIVSLYNRGVYVWSRSVTHEAVLNVVIDVSVLGEATASAKADVAGYVLNAQVKQWRRVEELFEASAAPNA